MAVKPALGMLFLALLWAGLGWAGLGGLACGFCGHTMICRAGQRVPCQAGRLKTPWDAYDRELDAAAKQMMQPFLPQTKKEEVVNRTVIDAIRARATDLPQPKGHVMLVA